MWNSPVVNMLVCQQQVTGVMPSEVQSKEKGISRVLLQFCFKMSTVTIKSQLEDQEDRDMTGRLPHMLRQRKMRTLTLHICSCLSRLTQGTSLLLQVLFLNPVLRVWTELACSKLWANSYGWTIRMLSGLKSPCMTWHLCICSTMWNSSMLTYRTNHSGIERLFNLYKLTKSCKTKQNAHFIFLLSNFFCHIFFHIFPPHFSHFCHISFVESSVISYVASPPHDKDQTMVLGNHTSNSSGPHSVVHSNLHINLHTRWHNLATASRMTHRATG